MKAKFILLMATSLVLAACGGNEPAPSSEASTASGEATSASGEGSREDSSSSKEDVSGKAAAALKKAIKETVDGKALGLDLAVNGTVEGMGMQLGIENLHIGAKAQVRENAESDDTMVTLTNLDAGISLGFDRLVVDPAAPEPEDPDDDLTPMVASDEPAEEEEEEHIIDLKNFGGELKYIERNIYADVTALKLGEIIENPMVAMLAWVYPEQFAQVKEMVDAVEAYRAGNHNKFYVSIDDLEAMMNVLIEQSKQEEIVEEGENDGLIAGDAEVIGGEEGEEEPDKPAFEFPEELFDYASVTEAVNQYVTDTTMNIAMNLLKGMLNAEIAENDGTYKVAVKTSYANIVALANFIGPMTDEEYVEVTIDEVKKDLSNLNEDNELAVTFDEHGLKTLSLDLEGDFNSVTHNTIAEEGSEPVEEEVITKMVTVNANVALSFTNAPDFTKPAEGEYEYLFDFATGEEADPELGE